MTNGEQPGEVPNEQSFGKEWAHEQALASAQIEGYVPSPEFVADSKAFREGLMTEDEFKARILARAKSKAPNNG